MSQARVSIVRPAERIPARLEIHLRAILEVFYFYRGCPHKVSGPELKYSFNFRKDPTALLSRLGADRGDNYGSSLAASVAERAADRR